MLAPAWLAAYDTLHAEYLLLNESKERKASMNHPNPEVEETTSLAAPVAYGVAIVTAILRLIPHQFNLSPLGALSTFGGGRVRSWQAYGLPLAVLMITDAFLYETYGAQTFSLATTPFVYASIVATVFLGRMLCTKKGMWRIILAGPLNSAQFFLITNTGFFFFGPAANNLPYSKTVSGLIDCYVQALPFAQWTLAGDLVFTYLIFGLYGLLVKFLQPKTARQVA